MKADEAALLVTLAALLGIGLVLFVRWLRNRRFGHPRLVPEHAYVRLGDTFRGVLEAGAGFGPAREVRFELVEQHTVEGRDYMRDAPPAGTTVRSTATVPVGAFQMAPGHVRVPVSLPVPADGWADFRRSGLRFSLNPLDRFLRLRSTVHAWAVRAAADVEGTPYRATFTINVAAAGAPPPGRYQAIVMPPSDKIAQSR